MLNKADNKKWWVFTGCGLMILLANIDVTIVNLALATIARDLGINLMQIQWILNSYLLTTAIFCSIGGKLADMYSAKKIFLIGTVLFGVASALAGFSSNFKLLIIARLLQGIGFACTLSLALLMISRVFPIQQRGMALGLAMTITGLGQALGPSLGGILLEKLNWHWIFLINVPLSLASFIIIVAYGTYEQIANKTQKIDYLGITIFAIALISLFEALSFLAHTHIDIQLFSIYLVISIIVFIFFYYLEKKTKFPLINFNLFLNRNYFLSITIRFLYMFVIGVFLFLLPLYMQNILNFSPLNSGLLLMVYSVSFGISSPLSGSWCDKIGFKIPIIVSSCLLFVAFIILAVLSVEPSIDILLIAFVLVGVAGGILIPSTVNSTLSSLPTTSSGEGLGIFFTAAFVGSTLGVAVSGAQLNFISQYYLHVNLHTLIHTFTPAQIEILHSMSNGSHSIQQLTTVFATSPYQNFQNLLSIVKHSFNTGFSDVMWLCTVLIVLITLMSIALHKKKSE